MTVGQDADIRFANHVNTYSVLSIIFRLAAVKYCKYEN